MKALPALRWVRVWSLRLGMLYFTEKGSVRYMRCTVSYILGLVYACCRCIYRIQASGVSDWRVEGGVGLAKCGCALGCAATAALAISRAAALLYQRHSYCIIHSSSTPPLLTHHYVIHVHRTLYIHLASQPRVHFQRRVGNLQI